MISINTRISRQIDTCQLAVSVNNSYMGEYDELVLCFRADKKLIEIISVSGGFISQKYAHIGKSAYIEITLKYLPKWTKIECVAAYYHKEAIVHNQTVGIALPTSDESFSPFVRTVSVSGNGFAETAFFKNSIKFGAGDIKFAHTDNEHINRSDLQKLPDHLISIIKASKRKR